MMSFFILIVSVIGMVYFSLSYCRALLAAYADCGVSARTRELSALAEGAIRGEDFGKLVSLIRVCPLEGTDSGQLRLVRMYFALLGAVGILASMSSNVIGWVAGEKANCTHVAAVMLDRRVLATIPSTK